MGAPRWLLPAGNYRDGFRERRRADVIIVTKTPPDATTAERCRVRRLLATSPQVPILFSRIDYGSLVPLWLNQNQRANLLHEKTTILLVTGIANPTPLSEHLNARVGEVIHLRYPDHFAYTSTTTTVIRTRFKAISNPAKLIVTTEKDAQRLTTPRLAESLTGLPIYVIPIRTQFEADDEDTLQRLIRHYCATTLGANPA